MRRALLFLDNNCLDRLGTYQRTRLRANLRSTGREYWPTSVNVLEALQTRNRETRVRLLETIADLAEDHLALTLPGEALRRIALSVATGVEINWSEPGITRVFRYPDSVTDYEVEMTRQHIIDDEANFNRVHETARQNLKPHIKDVGGMTRWATAADFIEDFWTSTDNLQPYIDSLWRAWDLPGPAPVEELLNFESFRLFFDGWGAATFARTVEHPQRGIVQSSDLSQLMYMGAGTDRVLATDDREFRNLGNAVLRGRYHLAQIVALDEMIC